jgi:hypothetical protein
MARWAADHAVDRIRDRFGWDAIGYGSVALGTSSSVPDEFRKLAEKKLWQSPVHRASKGACSEPGRQRASFSRRPMTGFTSYVDQRHEQLHCDRITLRSTELVQGRSPCGRSHPRLSFQDFRRFPGTHSRTANRSIRRPLEILPSGCVDVGDGLLIVFHEPDTESWNGKGQPDAGWKPSGPVIVRLKIETRWCCRNSYPYWLRCPLPAWGRAENLDRTGSQEIDDVSTCRRTGFRMAVDDLTLGSRLPEFFVVPVDAGSELLPRIREIGLPVSVLDYERRGLVVRRISNCPPHMVLSGQGGRTCLHLREIWFLEGCCQHLFCDPGNVSSEHAPAHGGTWAAGSPCDLWNGFLGAVGLDGLDGFRDQVIWVIAAVTGADGLLSGPIKSESPNSLSCRGLPKNRESKNQRILSRFPQKTKIRESIWQMHTM